jgi:hypothetical protein
MIVGGFALKTEYDRKQAPAKPLVAGSLAWVTGTLPDTLEPACHPNHRRFFRSLAVAALVGQGVYEAWKWKPKLKYRNGFESL